MSNGNMQSGSGHTLTPELFDPTHDGVGTFVTLDYTTTTYATRYEHAVLLLPKEWDSMYELIRAPGHFIEAWRRRYQTTPDHWHKGFWSKEWELKSPITIIIEPLAVLRPDNVATLAALVKQYPGFATPVNEWSISTPQQFMSSVMTAAANPAPIWQGTGGNPFPLQYVVEFALETSTVTIKYLAHNIRSEIQYANPITTATIDPVAGTNLTFIHFDVDFLQDHTFDSVADLRARFAMDFITNPGFINTLTCPGTFKSTAPFMATSKSNSLVSSSQVVSASQPFVTGRGLTNGVGGPPYYQPRVLIDSVWTDPSDVPSIEPIPPICLLLTANEFDNNGTTGYVSDELLIKAYTPPPPPPPTPGGQPKDDPPGPQRG
jgi:hypothetical protein